MSELDQQPLLDADGNPIPLAEPQATVPEQGPREEGAMERAKRLLAERGVDPINFKHLGYAEILKLAGIKP